MQRRHFLAATAAGLSSPWTLGWAAPQEATPPRLVVVLLRGAVDGLHVVVPHADPAYRSARPTLALASPGQADGVLALDARFGLHPALSPLMPWWQQGQLGFVHACGSPASSRSHFDAQDDIESGTPGRHGGGDGWLNRLAGILATRTGGAPSASPPDKVATLAWQLGVAPTRILRGPQAVSTLPQGKQAGKPTAMDRPRVAEAFSRLYDGQDALSQAYRTAQTNHRTLLADLDQTSLDAEMLAANQGAPLPQGFAQDAARLAQLMRREPTAQLAFVALGGWDTHINQGGAQGQLARRLSPLAQGLDALAQGLGPVLGQTTIVVLSEFGRTVHENGNGGTDHGHGNVMWLLGGRVQGGQVHGRWPGLAPHQLFEGRDLAITTDFRDVVGQVLRATFDLNPAELKAVFPRTAGDTVEPAELPGLMHPA
jgi:uncharacterized protein (DUF1501 family)